MARKIIVFIQSKSLDLYVNILTHCVKNEGVRDIYFAINEGAVGKLSEPKEQIRKIKSKFEELLANHTEYQLAYNSMPSLVEVEDRIIRVPFTNPELSIRDVKSRFPDINDLIVDISGCSKKVSSDVLSSYISSGISHICCFELDDQVYSEEWQKSGLSRMYHDIRKDIIYYEYVDFSKSGTTIKSFDRMRSQGKIIRLLFAISIILVILVLVLIQQQQNAFAQYAALALAFVTGLGFFNDIFGIVDRLK